MTPQVRFHIALCMEHVGLLTQALDGFTHAEQEAAGVAPEVVAESREHIRDLEKRTPTVTIAAGGVERGDELLLDRRPIPLGNPPLPLRVDPGPHTAELRRGTEIVASATFVAEPESTRRIELHDASAAPSPPRPLSTATTPTPRPPPVAPAPSHVQRTVGIAVMGVGGAALVATAVFAGLRAGALSDLDASCPTEPRCARSTSGTVDGIVSRGKTYATLANVLGIAAGVSLLGGATLWLTAPSPAGRPASARRQGAHVGATPLVGVDGAGIGVAGSF
jgi:hypothetical protein